ncbi:hypothetical protein JANAI62_31810 [Jannaschia pagri]|uniref:Transposase n=1 Tax=Jannaschia pagri TaxID=2829797 RepID=A0ABQ4NQA7_9RHOB|nr:MULTISPECIES: DUF6525 family protein [unclassified Jannaschia]GIT92582.1 hypothetical protein JANAI61_30400 [Jannaschia sp. AI_61]GIT96558.1 hypothetical protein JANAI62_31810 [Jannaschia sp. AI_62]
MSNQRTNLTLSRAQRDNMAAYDRLPPVLRRWLAEAKLPWSPETAKRAWRKARWKAMGREAQALRIMDEIEAQRLRQDALVQQQQAAIARVANRDQSGG